MRWLQRLFGGGLPYRGTAGSAGAVNRVPCEVSLKYNELLYAVARKFPGESRHETALRYIRDAERRALDSAVSAATPGQNAPAHPRAVASRGEAGCSPTGGKP